MVYLNEKIQNCIKSCLECYQTCVRTKVYCMDMGGKHAEARHISMLDNCAEICKFSAHFMLDESEYQNRLCEICAEICEACAEDCRKFKDDETMQKCAEICDSCAEACRKMVA